jgi:muramoyltetrapeptide carboxypeptidase LdcA involved in peptidoglycan recycling
LMNALKNKYIKAIFSTIWWDDSIRILPYIDFEVIKNNPKIFMGYSDSTITHFIFYYAGIRSYYWPSIMWWFDENCWIYRYMEDSIYKTLFINEIIWEILQNTNWWTSEFLDWNNKNNSKIKRNLNKENSNWRFLQWEWKIYWELLGWCIDVFPFMWWTKIWPEKKKWKWKILFFETSEEKISEIQLERILRVLGIQGILQNLNWIIVWKSIDWKNYDKTILKIVNTELSLNLPIITNMDFWHIHPVFILPIWAKAELDFENKKFSILESWVK